MEDKNVSNSIKLKEKSEEDILFSTRLLVFLEKYSTCFCCSSDSKAENKNKYDAYICYKKCDGKYFASLVQTHLQSKKQKTFFDVAKQSFGGNNEKQFFESIQKSKSFLLILTQAAVNALIYLANGKESQIYKELKYAIEKDKNIIPIISEGIELPETNKFIHGICEVTNYVRIQWNHENQNECIKQIINFIKNRKNTYF